MRRSMQIIFVVTRRIVEEKRRIGIVIVEVSSLQL